MSNPGAYPIDPTSDVGKFRAMYPDTNSVPFDPPVSGQADYENFSDLEIEAFILAGGGSVFRALGLAALSQAGQASRESASIADHDLRIDVTKRATDLRAQAQFWFDAADAEDASAEDAFILTEMGRSGDFIPELTPPVWGRRYTWGRWL